MITVENKIGVPKYKQIVNSIEEAIAAGELRKGDQLPSINSVRDRNSLSRDTVLTAFNELKNRGIIQSVVGKGYYVSSEHTGVQQKIFLLFDELNSFKEDLYNSFLDNLGDNIQVDIFFHHFNDKLFSKLINDNIGAYNFYVIMPANMSNTHKSLKNLPSDKVFILDQIHPDLNDYSAVYQDFEKDIYSKLQEALELIKHYEKLVLVFDEHKQPKGMLYGFKRFCEEFNIQYSILTTLKNCDAKKGEVYIIPDDKNLLRIIKAANNQQLILGKDFGIISYNETLLKEIVAGGITTISTDFKLMGKRLAEMIINMETGRFANSNSLIIRQSL